MSDRQSIQPAIVTPFLVGLIFIFVFVANSLYHHKTPWEDFTDFSIFWLAGKTMLEYITSGAHDQTHLLYFEPVMANTFGQQARSLSWNYPPTGFLFFLPLGLMPEPVSRLVYNLVSVAVYAAVAARLVRFIPARHRLSAALVFLSFPAFWLNLWAEQNGILLSSLLFLSIMERQALPALSGAIIGAVACLKPHLALPLGFILVFPRQREAFITGMVGTAVVLIMTSEAFVGAKGWIVWLHHVGQAVSVNSHRSLMVSSAVLFQGLPKPLCEAMWVMTAVGFGACVAAFVKESGANTGHGSGWLSTCAITLLAWSVVVPYLMPYDLVIGVFGLVMVVTSDHGCFGQLNRRCY